MVGLMAHGKAGALAPLLGEEAVTAQRPIGRVGHFGLMAVKATVGADQPLRSVMAQLAASFLPTRRDGVLSPPIVRVVIGTCPENAPPDLSSPPMAIVAHHAFRTTVTVVATLQRMTFHAQMRVSGAVPLVGIVNGTCLMTGAPQPV